MLPHSVLLFDSKARTPCQQVVIETRTHAQTLLPPKQCRLLCTVVGYMPIIRLI